MQTDNIKRPEQTCKQARKNSEVIKLREKSVLYKKLLVMIKHLLLKHPEVMSKESTGLGRHSIGKMCHMSVRMCVWMPRAHLKEHMVVT